MKNLAIGTISGRGAGAGVVRATKGKQIHDAAEARLNFTLTNSVAM